MEQQINELKALRSTVAIWEDQKYQDDQARQEAMMRGRRHNEKTTELVIAKLREAEAALATFEMYNYDVVDALEEQQAAEAKAKTDQAIKSAWNS